VDPVLGSLVYQLPGGVTLEYDLHLGRTIARWKFIDEEIHFGGSIRAFVLIEVPIMKKHRLGPQNGPGKFRTEKLLKIVSFQKLF
jgi:hypothetical protein